MVDKKQIEKRLKDGWIRAIMQIEVLATSKETTEQALKNHIEKMKKEEKIMITKEEFEETQLVKNPIRNIEEAYTQIVEIEILTENFDRLIYMTMRYAPSGIEILEPEVLKIDMGEGQGILNSVADLVHKFAAAGIGGVIIEGKNQ